MAPSLLLLQQVFRDGFYKSVSTSLDRYVSRIGHQISDSMPSFLSSVGSLSRLALTYSQVALISQGTAVEGGSPAVCTNPQQSCKNTTIVSNLCCFNAPGGQMVQTQFWDYSPSTGPSNSWTVHGLWPDHCDGTYDANCDPSRAYTNISAIISAAGKTDLLNYMNTYWKDYQGNDESFWEHEWEKHGTCISTLNTKCYTNYSPQEEVVDYFQTAVNLFKTLPSYQWLAQAGIVPSTTKTYTSAAILAALTKPRGVTPSIQCKNGALDEIWYFYDVKGSVVTGTFVPTNPDGSKSSCPASGITYNPKSGSPAPTTSSTSTSRTITSKPTTSPTTTTSTTTSANSTSSIPTGPTSAPGAPFAGKGYLEITMASGAQTGCIISSGSWFTTGTCATFTASDTSAGFTLTSSKGACGIVNGGLKCGSGTTASVFTTSNSDLAFNDSPKFYAAQVPSGQTQVPVRTDQGAEEISITWKAA